jgi:NhaA family Na+:H+ antiporter
MATDIAFALGALALVAPRLPIGAKVFLAALAIVDDMGAVIVIALFYTGALDWTALGFAALALGGLVALNMARVMRLMPYLVLGVVLWFFVHRSGIHSTIAGVVLALTIPPGRASTRRILAKRASCSTSSTGPKPATC